MTTAFSPLLLVPVAKVLLIGTFAYALLQAMRGRVELAIAFERLVVAFLALIYFLDAALRLEGLSLELTALIGTVARDDLRAVILDAFRNAATAPTGSGESTVNLPAILEQAWRTGIWGIMSALVEGTFLIVAFVLECAKEVLWTLLLVLFPLACGAFPIFPRLMSNLALYALELSLWFPMLVLVERVAGHVAKGRMQQAGSWGLYLVAVEVVAILLIILIPSMTHKFMSGAFAGDFNSQQGIFVLVQRIAPTRMIKKGGGK
ncbi:MAG: hypothetical protein IT285_06715 [Bdellovibrionales bacterium]|nr:hypothetical protein [Bdellovibrionales bacterium]